MRREGLDDGTIVEELVTEVNGREYVGTLTIRRIDRTKSAFEVSYGVHFHQDKSLFDHVAVDQMRLHARSVLKRLVSVDLEGDK